MKLFFRKKKRLQTILPRTSQGHTIILKCIDCKMVSELGIKLCPSCFGRLQITILFTKDQIIPEYLGDYTEAWKNVTKMAFIKRDYPNMTREELIQKMNIPMQEFNEIYTYLENRQKELQNHGI